MNLLQTSRILKQQGINGFRNVGWELQAPEVIGNDSVFFSFIYDRCELSNEEYDDNKVLFVLFRNCSAFKRRIDGTVSDSWLTKATFGSIAPECYHIMESQQDLEDWQIKLKETFRGMCVELECGLCKEKKDHIISLEKENEKLKNQIAAYDKLYHL